jgi:hypothetical protein
VTLGGGGSWGQQQSGGGLGVGGLKQQTNAIFESVQNMLKNNTDVNNHQEMNKLNML